VSFRTASLDAISVCKECYPTPPKLVGGAVAPLTLEPHRLVFLDETGTTTKMTRPRGRALKGKHLRSKAPFGYWKTQTFVAGLRCDALTAPLVTDAPMDRRIFEAYVETQPRLEKGDIVIDECKNYFIAARYGFK
jgi:hypothetical protein